MRHAHTAVLGSKELAKVWTSRGKAGFQLRAPWPETECFVHQPQSVRVEPLLFPRVAVHVVAVLLPEAGEIDSRKFEAAHPLH